MFGLHFLIKGYLAESALNRATIAIDVLKRLG